MPDPHVGAKRTVKLSTGNYGSEGLEVWGEEDVSSLSTREQTREAIVRKLEMEIEDFKAKHTGKSELPKPVPTPLPTPVPTAPAFGALPSIPKAVPTVPHPTPSPPPAKPIPAEIPTQLKKTDAEFELYLDGLPWKQSEKNPARYWISVEQQYPDVASLMNRIAAECDERGYFHLGGFVYRSESDDQFIGRYPAKPKALGAQR